MIILVYVVYYCFKENSNIFTKEFDSPYLANKFYNKLFHSDKVLYCFIGSRQVYF